MQELIDVIRAATEPNATPEQKAIGVQACRTIATALDTEPGKPLPLPTAVPIPNTSRVSLDQVLDLMIARLSVIAKTREETAAPLSTSSAAAPVTNEVSAPSPRPAVSRGLRVPIASSSALKVPNRATSAQLARPRSAPRPPSRVAPASVRAARKS